MEQTELDSGEMKPGKSSQGRGLERGEMQTERETQRSTENAPQVFSEYCSAQVFEKMT